MNLAKTIIEAIQKAVDAASQKGVSVKVEIMDCGFFPTERTEITITATPPTKEKA